MRHMFAVDSNFLLGILIVVAVIVYILVLKKLGPRVPAGGSSERNSKKTIQENNKKREYLSRKASEAELPKQVRSECLHHFGYLRTLPKNRALPNECLGCSKIVQCLAQESTRKSLRKRDST